MKDSLIDVGGGGQLAYTDIGRLDGVCPFFFHGAPMSRLHLVDLEDEFAARGLRVRVRAALACGVARLITRVNADRSLAWNLSDRRAVGPRRGSRRPCAGGRTIIIEASRHSYELDYTLGSGPGEGREGRD